MLTSVRVKQVFILSTLLVMIFFCSVVFAQPKISRQEHQANNLLIHKYVFELNKDLVSDDLKDNNTKDTLLVDSLTHEIQSRYNDGQVSYSPDKKFKIFVINGEYCGAHCNCMHRGYIQIGLCVQNFKYDMLPVEAIFKLSDDKYLVIQKDEDSGGTVIYDHKWATLISIKGNKVIYHPINYSFPKETKENNLSKDGILRISQVVGIDEEFNRNNSLQLKFDGKTKKLFYSYLFNFNQCCNQNVTYLYSGYFRYVKGVFLRSKEIKRRIN